MREREWDGEISEELAAELEARLGARDARRRGFGKVELKDVLASSMGGVLASSDATSRAAALWAEAAGEAGSRHTCGIYVKEGEAGGLPTLIVYLDGHSFVYEFATDHLLYEQRMAYLGFPVEKIEFRLSNRRAPSRSASAAPREAAHPAETNGAEVLRTPAPLTASEEAWAEGLVGDLPKELADAILGAIRASKRDEGDQRR